MFLYREDFMDIVPWGEIAPLLIGCAVLCAVSIIGLWRFLVARDRKAK
jgi:hypothetical protein